MLGRLQLLDQFLQHFLHVADDRNVDLDALGNGRRIDVDMDDLARPRREVIRIADHAVVETRADGDQHVAVLHRHVGFVRTVHAEHAEEFLVARAVAAQAHQRIGDRIAEQIGKLVQFTRRVREHDAAAGIYIRALRRQQQRNRLADLTGVALRDRVVRAQRHALDRLVLARRLRHVLRNVDQHRAGTAGTGDVESFLDGGGEIAHVLHEEVVLHAGTRDADRVAFLECVLTDRGSRHLAADHDHRDRIHIGGGDAGHGIGDTGAGGHETNADLAGGARIGVGSMHGGLLVAHQHVLELVLLVQLVVNVEYRAAGIAPDEFDVFVGQCLHEHGGADRVCFVRGGRIRRGEFRAGHIH
ncbi:hypothetical protein QFZ96_004900 [Paraburkholderia youngii]